MPFDALVGRPMTIQLRGGQGPGRFFSGICSRFSQGARGPALTAYRAEVVPWLWLLTRKAGSRIFHEQSVPEIAQQVALGGDVTFELQSPHEARDYCVQYRETDFNFVSRLMEEEGIWFFFRHTSAGHRLVVADSSASHPNLGTAAFRTGGGREPRVFEWTKTQELRSGKVTLRDHAFELPHDDLEATSPIPASVQVGGVRHQLLLPANQGLETYDFPGGYAERFDGVAPGGGDQPGELAKILPVGQRTAGFRAQEEAVASVGVTGASLYRNFTAGHGFALRGHFNGDGRYVLTSVTHRARVIGDVRTAGPNDLDYGNTFTCIPEALQFRPPRATPKPVVEGTQTAYVVGPPRPGDLHGQVRPGEGAVPLGPPGQVIELGSGRRTPCGPRNRLPHGPPDRPGGHRRLPRGGSRPADHRRKPLQPRAAAPVSERTTRRSALKRGLAALGGLVGVGAGAQAGSAAAGTDGATALVLYGRAWRSYSRDRQPGELPRAGDRLTFQGELFDRPGGAAVGELYAAAFTLHGPGAAAGAAERLELHTFVLAGGTIVGTGAAGGESGVFAVLGGTGRYAGARGSYVARQGHHELGGDGTAEFVFSLLR